jgi:hypothetical protein
MSCARVVVRCDRVLNEHLTPLGLSDAQVRAAWVKLANPKPAVPLPSHQADAFVLEEHLGDVVRAMRVRYPNLKLVFLSSRLYAGYATTDLNPEPFAYESGSSVKWLSEAQVAQAKCWLLTGERAPDGSIQLN